MYRVGLVATLLLLCVGTAVVQTVSVVRVKSDGTIIWKPGFFVVLTTVKAGTALEVVSRQGQWYEVRLPATLPGASAETGFVAVSQVEPFGTTQPPESPARSPARGPAPPRSPDSARAPGSATDIGWRGFGQLGFRWFSATQSYDAIFGQPGGLWFGGGAEFRGRRGWFVNGAVQGFHKTGQRVFVSNGEVFKLGVADTVTILPIVFMGGYRWRHQGTVVYMGGGIGSYFYKEHTEFDDPSAVVTQHFVSYHVVGGLEWRNTPWLSTAAEVEYARKDSWMAMRGPIARSRAGLRRRKRSWRRI
jgi:hypothetical protein